jgi:pyruvate/2-oxoglutarate dehydrogenase complex dihydrolipoamide dehydrogenase (E3) component
MFHAALHAEELADLHDYGFEVEQKSGFDWNRFKLKRDEYIKKLNGIYQTNLENSKVEIILGEGTFIGNTYKIPFFLALLSSNPHHNQVFSFVAHHFYCSFNKRLRNIMKNS